MSTPGNSGKRTSLVVQLGRVYQNISPIFGRLDYIFRNRIFLNAKNSERPIVVLLSPPRSGSTLTYQVLRTGIESFYLSNFWNLLFATPALGGIISSKLIANETSSFSSDQGFVQGLSGEAEGLKFWSHWSGQKLDQSKSDFNVGKFKELTEILLRLKTNSNSAFICGYLPHVFCMQEIRNVLPKVLFVHLERDLLSTCYSIYKLAPKKWMSIRPTIMSKDVCKEMSRHEAITRQVCSIHQIINRDSMDNDTIKISFSEVCANPRELIDNIVRKARDRGILLNKKNVELPKKFKFKKINPLLNQDTEQLHYYINKLKAKNLV